MCKVCYQVVSLIAVWGMQHLVILCIRLGTEVKSWELDKDPNGMDWTSVASEVHLGGGALSNSYDQIEVIIILNAHTTSMTCA